MRRSIQLKPTPEGALVFSNYPVIVFHEYGTGIYAGKEDSKYPDQRGSTGSEAKTIPWTYFSERGGYFVTTWGAYPQPMFRPGYVAALAAFEKEKRKRGL
jgi:hypothetical protein